jgi:Protein of unknown function (DUF3575)
MKFLFLVHLFLFLFYFSTISNGQPKLDYPATLLKTNTLNFLFQGFSIAAEQRLNSHHSVQINYFQGHYNFITQNRMQGGYLGYRYSLSKNQYFWGKGFYAGAAANYQYECDRYNQVSQTSGRGFFGTRLDAGWQYLSPKKYFVFEIGFGYLVNVEPSQTNNDTYFDGYLRLNLSVGIPLSKLVLRK